MIVAARLSTLLGCPLLCLDDGELVPLSGGRRLNEMAKSGAMNKGPLVVVDDSVHTGESMQDVAGRFPDAVTAAVYVHPAQEHSVQTYARLLSMPHLFEWHFFGSNLVEQAAFDMDGIICEECPDMDFDSDEYAHWLSTAKPLWLPRPSVVPLIVTARLEKFRDATVSWLGRHGIQVKELVCGDWQCSKDRHEQFVPGDFKGTPFLRSGLKYFFESCPKQARAINAATGKPVICPPTGEVFQENPLM